MATRFTNTDPVPEGVGWRYQGTLKDETGAIIPAASFTSLTLKIYVLDASLTYIAGSPTPVNILNTGRGTIDAAGLLTITFLPTDSAISAVPAGGNETHVALIEGEYSGSRKFAHEVRWRVIDMAKRP